MCSVEEWRLEARRVSTHPDAKYNRTLRTQGSVHTQWLMHGSSSLEAVYLAQVVPLNKPVSGSCLPLAYLLSVKDKPRHD